MIFRNGYVFLFPKLDDGSCFIEKELKRISDEKVESNRREVFKDLLTVVHEEEDGVRKGLLYENLITEILRFKMR